MKIIILSQDTVIEGKLYRKGEIIPVEDTFNENVKEVIKTSEEVQNATE